MTETAEWTRAPGAADLRAASPQGALPWQSRYAVTVKPILDRVGAACLFVVSAPVMALIAAAVRCTLGPKTVLRQERVGLGGTRFDVLKFRTMLPDRRRADVPFRGRDRRVSHKSAEDPRHTPVGRWLRRWGLDELPQLWNVLRGEMSLIGPRPELPSVIDRHYEPHHHRRHLVRPGLTGLWQVTTRHKGELMYEFVELDLEYVESLSFRRDMSIAFETLWMVLRRQHAGS